MNINVKGLEPRMNVEQKGQRIRKALSLYFIEAELDNIMLFWQRNYSQEPAFVLQQFVSDICKTKLHQLQKKDMLQDIVRELNQLKSEKTNKSKVTVNKYQQCFEEYVFDIVTMLPVKQKKPFLQVYEQYILSATFKKEAAKKASSKKATPTEVNISYEKQSVHVSVWLNSLSTQLPLQNRHVQNQHEEITAHITSDLKLDLIQQLAAMVYSVLCDTVGPIDADDIVSQAIQQRYNAQQSSEIHEITQL